MRTLRRYQEDRLVENDGVFTIVRTVTWPRRDEKTANVRSKTQAYTLRKLSDADFHRHCCSALLYAGEYATKGNLKMAKISKTFAAALSPECEGMKWEDARDYIDTRTGNDLDCTQLDLLTDWTLAEDMLMRRAELNNRRET